MSTPHEPSRDPQLPDDRYGADAPYDDVYDDNGELAETERSGPTRHGPHVD